MNSWKNWPIGEIEAGNLPDNLRKIRPAIKRLYFRGNWDERLFKKSLAVVGSRRMTRYGGEMVDKFVIDLVANGVATISGFMYGIDSRVHWKTIEARGKTIAVLGGGLNFLTPIENNDLYTKILESGGLVVSEYKKDFRPTLWTFPQRNRIVAGLASLGVLIIEAGLKSGSLITARLAKTQGKKVWAVPGMINSPTSEGTNFLIKGGSALMITEITDILKVKSRVVQDNLFETGLNQLETEVAGFLKSEALTVDELARVIGRDIVDISEVISVMSIRGLVEEEAGKIYLKR